jgi:hypothetical protein
MAKTDEQRITATLQFLQNTTLATDSARNKAYLLAQDYVYTEFPNSNLPAYQQFSQSLSLGSHSMIDPNQQRAMTRALFLLWKAMDYFGPRRANTGFNMPFQNITQINQGTAQRVLTNYIYKAACLYESTLLGGTVAKHVLTQVFQLNPLAFLQDNKVFVVGSTNLDPVKAPQNVQTSNFGYNSDRDRYEFGSALSHVVRGAANVQVENVTAFHWTDERYVRRPPWMRRTPLVLRDTEFDQMKAIQLSGANPMVTTQFTGCAFCMAEYCGKIIVLISPRRVLRARRRTPTATRWQGE